jgi:hypothetical protein
VIVEYRGQRYIGENRSGGVASVDPNGPYARSENARWYFVDEQGTSVAYFDSAPDDTKESVRAQLINLLERRPKAPEGPEP